MSIIRVNYVGGKAGVLFDLLSKSYLSVGPDNYQRVHEHPAFIRQHYRSLSGLSGELIMADSGLIETAETYRPQHGEWPFEPVLLPLIPVDRNELLYEYPVIFGWSYQNENDDPIVCIQTHDTDLVLIENKDEPDETREESIYFRSNSGLQKSLTVRVCHHGQLDNRKFWTAFRIGAAWFSKTGLVYSVSDSDTRHPIGLCVYKDHMGIWFYKNEYGLYENFGTSDPVLSWANSDKRPVWAPTYCEPFDLSGGNWALLHKDRVLFFGEDGKYLAEKLLCGLQDRLNFLQSPEDSFRAAFNSPAQLVAGHQRSDKL